VGPFLLGEDGEDEAGVPREDRPTPKSKVRLLKSNTKATDGVEVVGEPATRTKKNSKENKKLKIDLLGKWLVEGTDVTIDGEEAKTTQEIFLKKWLPKEKAATRKKAGKEKQVSVSKEMDTIKKLDDVTDSLLQGVAWLRWQENRQTLLKEFEDKLE
jgi:cruciform cutting endonuclease 1